MGTIVGPYCDVEIAPGKLAPFYAIRFDKNGRSESPVTQQHLVDALAAKKFTDVYLFCHGWNNDWATALKRYRNFIDTYRELQTKPGLTINREYRPVVVGVFWPSTAFVKQSEEGPIIAGGDGEGEDADVIDPQVLEEIVSRVNPEAVTKVYELFNRDALGAPEARELASILAPAFVSGDDGFEGDSDDDIDVMLDSWGRWQAAEAPAARRASATKFGTAGGGRAAQPQVAGMINLNPRDLARSLTVRIMKDRAGTVGTRGVGPMLRDMLTATPDTTRFHLWGHSYGARVALNAIARPHGAPLPRAVNSLLLLQPAVNHLCFAKEAPNGKPGGYRKALSLVKQPILSTFSANDVPLTKLFHLALRRSEDLGDIGIAAGEPPSKYAALGGFGPRGLDEREDVDILDPPTEYDLTSGAEVLAVDGTRTIASHGAVVNESTAWAMFSLARG